MTLEDHEYDDENIHPYVRRVQTPARILQVRFVGFVNALFNYILWLRDQDDARYERSMEAKDGDDR